MRLLLDEMISPRIARELLDEKFDVQAIKADRPDLESVADLEIVRRLAAERRMVVTNDATMPRRKASIPVWVETLKAILEASPADDALRNRIRHLS